MAGDVGWVVLRGSGHQKLWAAINFFVLGGRGYKCLFAGGVEVVAAINFAGYVSA